MANMDVSLPQPLSSNYIQPKILQTTDSNNHNLLKLLSNKKILLFQKAHSLNESIIELSGVLQKYQLHENELSPVQKDVYSRLKKQIKFLEKTKKEIVHLLEKLENKIEKTEEKITSQSKKIIEYINNSRALGNLGSRTKGFSKVREKNGEGIILKQRKISQHFAELYEIDTLIGKAFHNLENQDIQKNLKDANHRVSLARQIHAYNWRVKTEVTFALSKRTPQSKRIGFDIAVKNLNDNLTKLKELAELLEKTPLIDDQLKFMKEVQEKYVYLTNEVEKDKKTIFLRIQ